MNLQSCSQPSRSPSFVEVYQNPQWMSLLLNLPIKFLIICRSVAYDNQYCNLIQTMMLAFLNCWPQRLSLVLTTPEHMDLFKFCVAEKVMFLEACHALVEIQQYGMEAAPGSNATQTPIAFLRFSSFSWINILPLVARNLLSVLYTNIFLSYSGYFIEMYSKINHKEFHGWKLHIGLCSM